MATSCQDRSIRTMKSKFNTSWTASKQPRKQRKYIANAPLHLRHKFLSAQLSKELRKKHNKKSFPLRKGDEVLVMRGSHKKKKAKITSINLAKSKVVLEGIQQSKRDGSKVAIPFTPSNLQIQTLVLDDRKRIKSLTGVETKPEAKEAPKPSSSKQQQGKDLTDNKSSSKSKEKKQSGTPKKTKTN